MREYIAIYIALVYLNVLDTLLTMWHISHGAIEQNPLTARLLADFGISGIIEFKLIVLIMLGYLFWKLPKIMTKYMKVITAVTIIYAGLILYSVAILP